MANCNRPTSQGTGLVWFFVVFAILIIPAISANQVFPIHRAYAQMPYSMNSVNGTFTDKIDGYSITFPDGWSGFSAATGAMVLPGGIENIKNFNQTATITVGSINRTMLAEFAGKLATVTQAIANSSASSGMKSFAESYQKACGTPDAGFKTINGFSAFRITVSCDFTKIGANGSAAFSYMKEDMVMVATQSNVIALMYSTFSSEADQKYYPDFTNSLATFKVDNAEDFQSVLDQISGVIATTLKVNAAGNAPVNLPIASNSKVSNLSVNSDSNTLSFTVDGGSSGGGMTRVAVDKVLSGPYVVTVDGNKSQNAMQLTDDKTNETYLTIGYPTSHHTIVVQGTQVVPEFPVAALSIAGILVGITVLAGRFARKKFGIQLSK